MMCHAPASVPVPEDVPRYVLAHAPADVLRDVLGDVPERCTWKSTYKYPRHIPGSVLVHVPADVLEDVTLGRALMPAHVPQVSKHTRTSAQTCTTTAYLHMDW